LGGIKGFIGGFGTSGRVIFQASMGFSTLEQPSASEQSSVDDNVV
jgi:hypothetical protein